MKLMAGCFGFILGGMLGISSTAYLISLNSQGDLIAIVLGTLVCGWIGGLLGGGVWATVGVAIHRSLADSAKLRLVAVGFWGGPILLSIALILAVHKASAMPSDSDLIATCTDNSRELESV